MFWGIKNNSWNLWANDLDEFTHKDDWYGLTKENLQKSKGEGGETFANTLQKPSLSPSNRLSRTLMALRKVLYQNWEHKSPRRIKKKGNLVL